jgi:hypothetical protein
MEIKEHNIGVDLIVHREIDDDRYNQPSKSLVLMGLVGVGKSTIFNILHNDDHHLHSLNNPQKIGNRANSITSKMDVKITENQLMLVDTPGLLSSNINDLESIIKSCKQFFFICECDLTIPIIVVRADRLTESDLIVWDILNSMFGNNWFDGSILVLTTNGSSFDEKDNSSFNKEEWSKGNRLAETMLKSFNQVVVTNNSNDVGFNLILEPIRGKFLIDIKKSIIKVKQGMRPVVKTLSDFFKMFMIYYEKHFSRKGKMEFFSEYLRKIGITTTIGLCSICDGDVTSEYAAAGNCRHKFHYWCIFNWLNQCEINKTKLTCPNCRCIISNLSIINEDVKKLLIEKKIDPTMKPRDCVCDEKMSLLINDDKV